MRDLTAVEVGELLVHLASLIVEQSDDCWTIGEPGPAYPMIEIRGRRVQTHRLMYALTKGPVPAGMVVDHDCHNLDITCPGGDTCWHRRCCRPEHLLARTPAENTAAAQPGIRTGIHRPRTVSGYRLDDPEAAFISTRALARKAGLILDEMSDQHAVAVAASYGRRLAALYPGLRTQQRMIDGRRHRGYLVVDLPEHLAQLARHGTAQTEQVL